MVDKITPSYPVVPSSTTVRPRDKVTQAAETHSDDKGESPDTANYRFVERRKGKDRRASAETRQIYDMRSSRGRRRSDREHPSIEIDA